MRWLPLLMCTGCASAEFAATVQRTPIDASTATEGGDGQPLVQTQSELEQWPVWASVDGVLGLEEGQLVSEDSWLDIGLWSVDAQQVCAAVADVHAGTIWVDDVATWFDLTFDPSEACPWPAVESLTVGIGAYSDLLDAAAHHGGYEPGEGFGLYIQGREEQVWIYGIAAPAHPLESEVAMTWAPLAGGMYELDGLHLLPMDAF